MKIKKLLAVFCAVAIVFSVLTAKPEKAEAMGVTEFLNTVGPMATADMHSTGILASLTLAQAILESGWGTSELALNANALFGMKAGSWTGPTYWYNGSSWRAYGSWQESVTDHGRHLSTMARYANLVGETDYRTACYNVAADGYCSDYGYADSLINLIETYNLTQYDIYGSRILEGHEPIDIGFNFYAHIRHPASGNYITNGGNVYAAPGVFDQSQTWFFGRKSDGSYSLSTDGSTYWMDVADANYVDGANIQTHIGNGSLAQRFFIYYINEKFYFKTVAGDKVFDIDAASNNLQLCGSDTGTDQVSKNARAFEILKIQLDGYPWNANIGKSFTAYIKNCGTGYLMTEEGVNVAFRRQNYAENQKWIITRNEYGGHEIKSATSGRVLDVDGYSLLSGVDVGLYNDNDTMNQRFFFIHAGESRFYIKPSYSNTVLDMSRNDLELRTCFQGTTADNNAEQIFEIVTEQLIDTDLTVRQPEYLGNSFEAKIYCDSLEKYVTENNGIVSMSDSNGSESQIWKFTYDKNTNAYILEGASGNVIDTKDFGYQNGMGFQMLSENNVLAQRFRFYPAGHGYLISPAHTQKVWDVHADNLTDLMLWNSAVIYNRLFNIAPVSYEGKKPVDLGDSFEATIKNKTSGLYVSAENVVNVTCTNNATKWTFTRNADGSYCIKDNSSGRLIDIADAYVAPGTHIQLWIPNGGTAQNFFIYEENGGYVFRSARSGLALDMDATTKELHTYPTVDAASYMAQTFEISKGGESLDFLKLKDNSTYSRDDKFVTKVRSKSDALCILSQFENENAVIFDSDKKQVSSSKVCGTGYSVNLLSGNTVIDSLEIVVSGDVDGNGVVDSTDYIIVKNVFLNMYELTGAYFKAGDTDGNTSIDNTDYVRIKNAFLGTYSFN